MAAWQTWSMGGYAGGGAQAQTITAARAEGTAAALAGALQLALTGARAEATAAGLAGTATLTLAAARAEGTAGALASTVRLALTAARTEGTATAFGAAVGQTLQGALSQATASSWGAGLALRLVGALAGATATTDAATLRSMLGGAAATATATAGAATVTADEAPQDLQLTGATGDATATARAAVLQLQTSAAPADAAATAYPGSSLANLALVEPADVVVEPKPAYIEPMLAADAATGEASAEPAMIVEEPEGELLLFGATADATAEAFAVQSCGCDPEPLAAGGHGDAGSGIVFGNWRLLAERLRPTRTPDAELAEQTLEAQPAVARAEAYGAALEQNMSAVLVHAVDWKASAVRATAGAGAISLDDSLERDTEEFLLMMGAA